MDGQVIMGFLCFVTLPGGCIQNSLPKPLPLSVEESPSTVSETNNSQSAFAELKDLKGCKKGQTPIPLKQCCKVLLCLCDLPTQMLRGRPLL